MVGSSQAGGPFAVLSEIRYIRLPADRLVSPATLLCLPADTAKVIRLRISGSPLAIVGTSSIPGEIERFC